MKLICKRGEPYEYQDTATKAWYVSYSQVQAVLDPNAFSNVPDAVLIAAQQRGIDLHTIFGLLLLSRLNICEAPKRPTGKLAGYFDAMVKFIQEHQPTPVRVEESSINKEKRYAGTPDCLIKMGNDLALVDLKTGGKRIVHKTQLVAYKHMEGYTRAKQLGTLYVSDDGHYKLDLLPRHDEAFHWMWFQAGLAVLHGRHVYGI